MVKNLPLMQETQVRSLGWEVWSLGWEDPVEKEMATNCSFLAWRIPWTEEPGRLQSTESQRVRHNWVTLTFPAETTSGVFPTIWGLIFCLGHTCLGISAFGVYSWGSCIAWSSGEKRVLLQSHRLPCSYRDDVMRLSFWFALRKPRDSPLSVKVV